MAGRSSQDTSLPVNQSSTAAVRDSQDLSLTLKKASTAAVRDSQEVPLVVNYPSTAKVRASQDIVLYLSSSKGARDTQEAVLSIASATSSSLGRLSQDVVLTLVSNTGITPLASSCFKYYLSLFTSEYQGSTNFIAWWKSIFSLLCDIRTCADNLVNEFDIDQAIGVQLDILGTIIGVGRTVQFQPSGGVSPVLDDTTYRILLKAKVSSNQWSGQTSELYPLWTSLFPGGRILVQDNQNMTATILLAGAFTSIIQDLITHSLIIPRPETVQYIFVFATLPIFGCDQSNSFVAGVDLGHIF